MCATRSRRRSPPASSVRVSPDERDEQNAEGQDWTKVWTASLRSDRSGRLWSHRRGQPPPRRRGTGRRGPRRSALRLTDAVSTMAIRAGRRAAELLSPAALSASRRISKKPILLPFGLAELVAQAGRAVALGFWPRRQACGGPGAEGSAGLRPDGSRHRTTRYGEGGGLFRAARSEAARILEQGAGTGHLRGDAKPSASVHDGTLGRRAGDRGHAADARSTCAAAPASRVAASRSLGDGRASRPRNAERLYGPCWPISGS